MTVGRARLRVRFTKLGKIRWTSHRDVARMWERAFRRAELPLAYSEGFSPRPRISFGLALPTGHESVAEYLDVELAGTEDVDIDSLPRRLSAALPIGVDATAVRPLEAGTASLQEDVTSCSWRWLAAPCGDGPAPGEGELAERVAEALALERLDVTRTRKGTQVVEDIRAGIIDLIVDGTDTEGVWLVAELGAQPRAVRPADVLSAIGPGLEERNVRRTHQWIQRHGARLEPLPEEARSDATEAPHALGRAS